MSKPRMLSTLTERENQVAALIAKGDSNKIIAVKLDISEHTAKFHVNNVIKKIGAKTRVDAAVRYAMYLAGEMAHEKAIAFLEAKVPWCGHVPELAA